MDITLEDRLNVLQQISQRKLVDILEGIPGQKDLVIEQRLMKILDSFVGVSVLKKYGVDKIYKMDQGLKPTNPQRVFLVSTDLIACKRVLDQVQSEIPQPVKAHFEPFHHLIVTPFVPAVLHTLVEEEGLEGLVKLQPLSYELIKLDGNILSQEQSMFTDLFYHKDTCPLPGLAKSLWSLQMVLGSPRLTVSFGKHSQQALKMIEMMNRHGGSPEMENEVGAFIIMDRSHDFVTTLLTPVTYSALLHEVLDVNVGIATSGKSQTKLDPNKDRIYEEVRDTPCGEVFPILHGKAKSLKSEQEAIQTMKIAEMGKYVTTRLQKTRDTTQQLGFHIAACQKIADIMGSEFQNLQAIERSILERRERKECINYIERYLDDHPLRCLRLLCLLSITNDGVPQNDYQLIQKLYLHAHGYQDIPLFYKLQTAGLLKCKESNLLHRLPNWNSEWSSNAQQLKLLPNSSKQSEQKGRTCPSYVFNNAYIPLIAQTLSIVANQDKDPRSLDDLSNLPGCAVSGLRGNVLPKLVLICVIGGITYAEVSACRLVAKSSGIRLVLASDNILTGNKVIQGMQEI